MACLVIFDFDGVIYDARLPRDLAFDAIASTFSAQVGPCNYDIRRAPLSDPGITLRAAFAQSPSFLADAARIEDTFRTEIKAKERGQTLVPGVEPTLKALHALGCAVAVLSLRPEAELRELIKAKRIEGQFNFVFGGDASAGKKPSPDPVLELCRLANVKPKDALFVGDSDVDFDAARAAGVEYYHAGWSDEPSSRSLRDCALVLKQPQELRVIIEGSAAPSQLNRDKVLEAVSEGRFSFFAGAGVSIPSGLGGWADAYEPILGRHFPARLLQRFTMPEMVQMICADNDAAGDLYDAFKKAFDRPAILPNVYHYAMVRSACASIWTTNYDELFESASRNAGRDIVIVKDEKQMKDSFGRKKYIVKINGDFQVGSFEKTSLSWNVILADEQFDMSEIERAEMWRFFEDEYRTSTVIFVGVSFGDPTLRRVLSIASRRVMRTRKHHFVLVRTPKTFVERHIFNRQAKVLKNRNIHAILFDEFEEIERFIIKICITSRRPAVAFSGITHFLDASSTLVPEDELSQRKLDGGQMTLLDIGGLSARMGETLGRAGFRVVSGHGMGVGVPAVQAAFEIDKGLARFFLRKEGKTIVRRGVTVNYVSGSPDYSSARKKLIASSAVLIAMAGNSADEPSMKPEESGTVEEVEMAINAGVPVLLFPQAGGDVLARHQHVLMLMNEYSDPLVRSKTLEYNREISKMTTDALDDFVDKGLANVVSELLGALIASRISRRFDEACDSVAQDW